MKKELSPAAVISIVAVALILVGTIGFAFVNKTLSGGVNDKENERRDAEIAKAHYSRYANSTGGDSPSSGPPVSGEGEAQARNPGGNPK